MSVVMSPKLVCY